MPILCFLMTPLGRTICSIANNANEIPYSNQLIIGVAKNSSIGIPCPPTRSFL